jgi:hypothetical protein
LVHNLPFARSCVGPKFDDSHERHTTGGLPPCAKANDLQRRPRAADALHLATPSHPAAATAAGEHTAELLRAPGLRRRGLIGWFSDSRGGLMWARAYAPELMAVAPSLGVVRSDSQGAQHQIGVSRPAGFVHKKGWR